MHNPISPFPLSCVQHASITASSGIQLWQADKASVQDLGTNGHSETSTLGSFPNISF